jgi:hypothetical protein
MVKLERESRLKTRQKLGRNSVAGIGYWKERIGQAYNEKGGSGQKTSPRNRMKIIFPHPKPGPTGADGRALG